MKPIGLIEGRSRSVLLSADTDTEAEIQPILVGCSCLALKKGPN